MTDVQKPKNTVPPVERIKANLLEIIKLTRDTIKYVSNNGYKIDVDPALCDLAVSLLAGWSSEKIVDGFIQRSFKYWPMIKERDEDFLLNNADVLFGELPTNVIANFTNMMKARNEKGESYVPKETKDCVWDLIHAMIKGGIKYVHESRRPEEVNGKKQYTVEFFPEIKIREQVEIWKIKL